MNPILYDKFENDFEHLGLGVLRDTIKCIVIEERNGVFELNMEYPITGALFDLIKNDYLIKASAGYRLKNQLFRIKRIDTKMDGVVKIHAVHVSYLTQDLALKPYLNIVNAPGQIALNQWRNAVICDAPFEVFSDVSNTETLHSSFEYSGNAHRPRKVLGEILKKWGGEFLFDNYKINLLNVRGTTANTILAYGRNLVDLEQEENISATFTSVYPFAIYESEDASVETITLPEFIVDSEYINSYPNRRVLPVDFSGEFEGRPTATELRRLAKQFIIDNALGIPRVSISVSFVDLARMSGGAHEELNLCDTVPVYFEKLGIKTRAKVVRIEWNVLLSQYEKVEIGEIRGSLSDRINNIESNATNIQQITNAELIAIRQDLSSAKTTIRNVEIVNAELKLENTEIHEKMVELKADNVQIKEAITKLSDRVKILEQETEGEVENIEMEGGD